MNPQQIRKRWKEIKGNREINKAYRAGFLYGVMWKTKNMTDEAFMSYMEECLGENWIEILKEHGLAKETRTIIADDLDVEHKDTQEKIERWFDKLPKETRNG